MSHAPSPSQDLALLPHRYGESRGGAVMHDSDARSDDLLSDSSPIGLDAHDTVTSSNAQSLPRHVRLPPGYEYNSSGCSSALQSLTSNSTLSTLSTLEGSKLELTQSDAATRDGVLRETFFDQWKDDATHLDTESPEEMQKKDPIGLEIWKLYRKTKGQLPNSERLENLSWRMMTMNLRRMEQEKQT